MGRIVQLSVLGRGRPAETGSGGGGAYATAVYRFEDGFECETSLFAYGLWQYLAAQGRCPDAMVLLGTPGSMWDALWEALPETSKLSEDVVAWHGALHTACVERRASVSMLNAASAPYTRLPFAAGLRLNLIPDCRTRAEIQAFCGIVMACLEPDDEVILDITHGYRHIPVMAAFLATSLRWLQGVTVRDVYYGALEMAERRTGQPSVAPVINLGYAATLAARGAACATYEITGRYGALAPFFPDQEADMTLADYYENLAQAARARGPATRLQQSFARETPGDPWLAAAAEKLSGEWRWTRNSQLHLRMLSQAENLFHHGEYFKSIAMLHEAFRLYLCKRSFGDYIEAANEAERRQMQAAMNAWTKENLSGEHQKTIDLLRVLRNVLIHNHHSNLREAQQLVDDRNRMRAFLEQAFALARKQLAL